MKKMPASLLYMVSPKPRSAFISSFAKPTFTRSSHEMMYSKSRNGSTRHVTRESVLCSSGLFMRASVAERVGAAIERSARRAPARGPRSPARLRAQVRREVGEQLVLELREGAELLR